MSKPTIIIYTKSEDIPPFKGMGIFHSRQLFDLYKATPRMRPYMIVAHDSMGNVIGNMLAVLRYRYTIIPPFIYIHCSIIGEGEYYDANYAREDVFGEMLHALRTKLSPLLFYIEVSNLSSKMFGYKEFKREGFFPVRWMSVSNSLHSKTPEERITQRAKARIDKAYERGAIIERVQTEEDFRAAYQLLHRYNSLKPKRYIPDEKFFREILRAGNIAGLFVTKYNNHVIGCCVCSYSESNACLWYSASRRKSYAKQHPDLLTIWHAIKDAHARGFDHFVFLDVGLPVRKSPYRDFIMSFGGKQVSTYRWFRFGSKWVNKLFSTFYK